MWPILVTHHLVEMVAHGTIGVDLAFFFEFEGVTRGFMVEAECEAFEVHVFELIVFQIELFVVAAPVEVNGAFGGRELLGAIDSHGEVMEAKRVTGWGEKGWVVAAGVDGRGMSGVGCRTPSPIGPVFCP